MVAAAPLALRLIQPEWTDRVPSPAHDSLTPATRRALLADNPDSFLAVTRSHEDLGPEHDVSTDELLALGRLAVDRLLDLGAFGPVLPAQYYAYQLIMDDHVQTGLVAGVATADFADGTVRSHEETHPERVEHLARHFEAVGMQSSPVALACRADAGLDETLRDATTGPPLVVVVAPSGFEQRIWAIDPALSSAITDRLAPLPLYLIDGHHRGAAAVRHSGAAAVRHSGAAEADDRAGGPHDHVLSVVFPSDRLRNHAFHRVLPTDLGRPFGRVRPRLEPGDPARWPIEVFDGESGDPFVISAPPVADGPPSLAALPPSRLADRLDRWLDPRWRDVVDYRPGVVPHDELLREIAAHRQLLFRLDPIDIDDLFAVADAGLTMPPKSTYFEPKVRSGIFLRQLGSRSR